jgi:predicted Zn-dependent protease
LTSHLASIFDASITILTDLPQLDSFRVLFNEQRNQLNSDKLLHWLATSIMDHIKSHGAGKTIILAIYNIDAYSLGLNFVFGQASLTGGVAAIYLPRLRQDSMDRAPIHTSLSNVCLRKPRMRLVMHLD